MSNQVVKKIKNVIHHFYSYLQPFTCICNCQHVFIAAYLKPLKKWVNLDMLLSTIVIVAIRYRSPLATGTGSILVCV